MENKESNYVKILKEICAEEGIAVSSYSSDWAFRFERAGRHAFVLGYQFGLNPSSVQQICNDKNITSEVLTEAGIPCVYHRCYMAPTMLGYVGSKGSWQPLTEQLREGPLVCKDNYGTGGNLVFRVTDQRELEQAAALIYARSEAMAVCRYEEIRMEYRLVILDGKIRLAFSKIRPSVTGDGQSTLGELLAVRIAAGEGSGYTLPGPRELGRVLPKGEEYLLNWKHNLGQGALARRLLPGELEQEAAALAGAAIEALGIRFASIDVIRTDCGFQILEVNAGVMMEHFAGLSEENYRIAREIYRDALLRML